MGMMLTWLPRSALAAKKCGPLGNQYGVRCKGPQSIKLCEVQLQ
jgi:hypothetical protein